MIDRTFTTPVPLVLSARLFRLALASGAAGAALSWRCRRKHAVPDDRRGDRSKARCPRGWNCGKGDAEAVQFSGPFVFADNPASSELTRATRVAAERAGTDRRQSNMRVISTRRRRCQPRRTRPGPCDVREPFKFGSLAYNPAAPEIPPPRSKMPSEVKDALF